MSLIAVADRTGSAVGWLAGVGSDHVVVPVDKPTEIGLAGPDADVLVLGPKEVSAAGLRRVATWKSVRPTAAVVALSEDTAGLAGADVLGVVDAVVDTTTGEVVPQLVNAVRTLTAVPEPAVAAPMVDMDSAMARLRRGRAVPVAVRPVTLRSRPAVASPEPTVHQDEAWDDDAPVDADEVGGDEVGGDVTEGHVSGHDVALHEEDDAELAWDDEGGYDPEPLTADEDEQWAPEAYAEPSAEAEDQPEDEPQDDEVGTDADEVGADEVGGDVLDGRVATPAAANPRPSLRPRPRPGLPRTAAPVEVAPAESTPAADRWEPSSEVPAPDSVETPVQEVAPPAPVDETPALPVQTGPGQVITVAAASGGCGKTLYSTNLAAFLSSKGLRVLLIDLDLQFGEVAMALRLRHPYSIYDGLYDPQANPLPDTAFTEHVGELVVHSELGFDVLCAPRDPRFADAITSEDAAFVIEVTRLLYDVVVIDTPPSLAPVALAALDRSSAIAVLVTLDVPSLRNLASYLDVLSDRAVDESLVKLLVNKVEPDIGLDVKGAQEAFGGRFQAELPADRSASRSVNKGVVVVRAEPKSALAKAISASFSVVLPPGLSHLAASPKKASFFSKLFSKS